MQPKDVFCGIYAPNRRLVEFMVEKRNVVGALAKIAERLAEKGVNILSGFLTAHPDEPVSTWSFVADLTGVDIEPSELAEELKKIDVVLNVKFAEPRFPGLMIDELHFPLRILNEKSITLRVDTFADMVTRLREVFGKGAVVILYEMGVKCGERKVASMKIKYGLKGREALEAIMLERMAKGWGIPEVVEFDSKRAKAVIQVRELFECLPFKGKAGEAKSSFFRGYLSGALSWILDKKMLVTEVKCIAKRDPICEFVAKKEAKM